MIARPSILLCDEPFGALDPIVRRDLQDAFRALRSGVTILFVTHDLAEALRVAERIVLFDGGRVVTDCPAGESLTAPSARPSPSRPRVCRMTATSFARPGTHRDRQIAVGIAILIGVPLGIWCAQGTRGPRVAPHRRCHPDASLALRAIPSR
jgi:ABC-type sulfate/molybdate transport systems ATPase subunit